jgi:hypothetical protein
MQTLKGLIGRMNRKPEAGVVRVAPSDDGFVASWEDGRSEELKWSEVERIFTYKVDCYAYDMIWLTFERGGHDGALHIREEAEGFQDLMSAMSKALPEINPEWYFNVMQPPFAENLTVLFERETEA